MSFPAETRKSLAIGVAILLVFSTIMVYHIAAASDDLYVPIYLPSGQITVQVVNGTESYFNTTLLDVPSGFNVTNEEYLGWCVDKTANMSRDTPFPATLYSSLNLTGTLANENWTMVNYILNHKTQGTDQQQIQDAIWYFINLSNGNNNTPPNDETDAWTMINDAKANGIGFIPENGSIVAVVCEPQTGVQQNVQISIIEVPTNPISLVPEFPIAAIPLLALGTLSLVIICRKKATHARTEKKTLT